MNNGLKQEMLSILAGASDMTLATGRRSFPFYRKGFGHTQLVRV
jgi:hypothetical protein